MPGVTAIKPDRRDRSGRVQSREYTVGARTRDRVRGKFTPEKRDQARALASLSCESYTPTSGM